jgi:mono/diheme cytochrome c family protein
MKSILATVWFALAIFAAICVLSLMGKSERKASPKFLRIAHKTAGFLFLGMTVVITYFCIKYVKLAGDNLSGRAIHHAVFAIGLIGVFLLKIVIVQFYKQFLRFVPALGMLVLVLVFVVYFSSAGFFFLRGSGVQIADEPVTAATPEATCEGDPKEGKVLYADLCGFCHHADREDSKIGPGLKGILEKDELPSSGRKATPDNVVRQLTNPVGTMPAFPDLSEEELADLIEYLKTL